MFALSSSVAWALGFAFGVCVGAIAVVGAVHYLYLVGASYLNGDDEDQP